MRKTLQDIFIGKDWSEPGIAPRSALGSTLEYTARLRAALPAIFRRYRVNIGNLEFKTEYVKGRIEELTKGR